MASFTSIHHRATVIELTISSVKNVVYRYYCWQEKCWCEWRTSFVQKI